MTHPIKRILEEEMRARFNANNYADRIKAGELVEHILDDRHPSLTVAHEPFCTHSQMISYRDQDGNEVARVHQYLRPDNTFGASGRPDPKRVLEDGILYRLVKKHNRANRRGRNKSGRGRRVIRFGDNSGKTVHSAGRAGSVNYIVANGQWDRGANVSLDIAGPGKKRSCACKNPRACAKSGRDWAVMVGMPKPSRSTVTGASSPDTETEPSRIGRRARN